MENRGYCGLNCENCDVFIATKNDDKNLREKLAKDCQEMQQFNIEAKDVNCSGCKSDGVRFVYCSGCEMRSCNIAKGYESCAECKEYPCEHEANLIDHVPDAREYIEKKRQ